MTTTRNLLVAALMSAATMLSATQAMAICVIATASITPLTGSTGTYTPPTAPTYQEVDLQISGTIVPLTLIGGCTIAVSFNRTTPASMAIAGGGTATLPYTINSSATGAGNTLFFTGLLPSASNVATTNITPSGLNYTATVKVFLLAQPGTPQAAGNYSDTITIAAFNSDLLNLINLSSSPSFTVTGSVAKTCNIGGLSNQTDNAVIPIKPGGKVDTTPIPKSYANAACNTPSNLQLSSANGGVKNNATPPAGFTNIINYSAAAMFAGATATLNTATTPGATGAETGPAVSTTGPTPSGTLSLSITPQANTQLLTVGNYSDTLTITITPQ